MKQNKKTLFSLLKQNKPAVAVLSFFALVITVHVIIPEAVFADDNIVVKAVADGASTIVSAIITGLIAIISSILDGVIALLGWILQLLVKGLEVVAQYGQGNEFAAQQEVILGWQIVRDVMNSFYIIVMIAIAIATILRYQPFHFKQALPRLILSAILVNFSRTICLLAINFSTSIMATFTTAINNAWPAFILGLRAPSFTAIDVKQSLGGIFSSDVQQAAVNAGVAQTALNSVTAIVLQLIAIVFLLATAAAIGAYLVYLVVRVIMLWLLMIISPLAFFAWGTPGSKASGQWSAWVGEFTKYVMAGPILLFFIYIEIMFMVNNTKLNYGFKIADISDGGISAILTPRIFVGYIVGMTLLLMGFEQTQKMSLRGGQFASKFDPNKVLNGAKNLALKSGESLNNYLYSRGLSVKPVAAWQGIKSSLAARDARNVLEGKRVWNERAGRLDGDGNRGLAGLAQIASGDAKFIEENGLLSLNRDSGLGRLVSATSAVPLGLARGVNAKLGVTDKLSAAGEGIRNTTGYKKVAEWGKGLDKLTGGRASAVAGGVLTGAKGLSGYTAMKALLGDSFGPSADVAGKMEALAEIRNSIDGKTATLELAKDQANLFGADGTFSETNVGDLVNAKEIFDLQDELAVTEDSELRQNLETEIARRSEGMNPQDLESYRKERDMVDEFASNITAGYTGDGLERVKGQSVTATMQELDTSEGKAQRAEFRGRLTAEMRKRRQSASTTNQELRTYRAGVLSDIKKKLYPKGVNVEVAQVHQNALADRTKQDRDRWKAHVIQAAEGSDLLDFYQLEGKQYTLDPAGIRRIHKMHKAELGMSEEESMEFIDQLMSITGKNRQITMSNMTEKDDLGQVRFATRAEYNQGVKKEFLKKPMEVFTKGGRAGIGTQDADGNWSLHKGVLEGALANPQAFVDQWSSSWARSNADSRQAKMWVDSGQLDAIRQAAEKEQLDMAKVDQAIRSARLSAKGA